MLHSQTLPTPSGAMNYTGDLYTVGEPMSDLLQRIRAHLSEAFPATHSKLSGTNDFGRRALAVLIESSDADLTDQVARDELIQAITDEVWRFGFDKSNPKSDVHNASFRLVVGISDDFWARRQRLHGPSLIDDIVKVSAFKRQLQPGHVLEVLEADEGVGKHHRVISVASRIVVDDGTGGGARYHWSFPSSAAFLCDGTKVRISRGSTQNPDAYTLLKWTR